MASEFPAAGPAVVHANTEGAMRGGEVQTLGLMVRLQRAGIPCLLAAPAGAPLSERASRAGIPLLPWSPRGELDLRAALALRRALGGGGVRLVHAHTAHALSLALLARAGLEGLPTVASRRVSFPLRGFVSRRKYRAADRVVAVSAEIREGLLSQGIPPERVVVIHSGVDLDRFRDLGSKDWARKSLGIPDGTFLVGCVGALVAHKGQDLLIEALASRSLGPSLLLLAGEGPLRESLARKAEGLGVKVRFLGYVAEPAPVYRALDCLVLPSRSGEGSPGVVKEAAAAGVPVVATAVGGTAEILRDGAEALLVAPGDPGALGAAVGRIHDGPDLRERLAAAALERVKVFGMDRMAEEHLRLYRTLADL